jgi:hypothetical protein
MAQAVKGEPHRPYLSKGTTKQISISSRLLHSDGGWGELLKGLREILEKEKYALRTGRT